jgi:O-antigen ligase
MVVVGAGVVGLRGSDISDYLGFLGFHKAPAQMTHIATGPQRTMLAYIGLRIWADHPWLGVGFERSQNRYQPYLADTKRRFPGQDPRSYPSPAHPWGVQSFWVQLLADNGVVGFVLGVATFAVALGLALRATRAQLLLGLVAVGWILVAAGTWIGEGIVAGIPLQAVTWLGFGLAATVGGIE